MQPASAISAFVAAYPTLAFIILFFLPARTSAVVANPFSPHISASISFNVSAVIAICHASPSVQLVSHHLLQPSSPDVAAAAWAASAELHAKYARYAAWFPYQRLGVAELDPPSGPYLCGPSAWAVGSGGGSIGQTRPVQLTCSGSIIASIDFASYGQPTGTCGSYSFGSCHATSSLAVVQSLCLNRSSCSVPITSFGPPPCDHAYLAVQARCADGQLHTYWDFRDMDQQFFNFWRAFQGETSEPIVGFCTAPSWLYNDTDYTFVDDAATWWYGYNRGTAPAGNISALGDYYGRVAAWYMLGSFQDEYGRVHASGRPPINITRWEVGNEVDYEHGHTAATYTMEYDAIVSGIWKLADPNKRLSFSGLALPNIDDVDKVETWVRYFLNSSNHDDDVQKNFDRAVTAIGYHAYPTTPPYLFTKDPESLKQVFAYVDDVFLPKVARIDAAIAETAPHVRSWLDECGLDMDQVLGESPPPDNNPLYWTASGSYFAYLFAKVAQSSKTVDVIGHSQIMDGPGQEPSVSLLDWTTGSGTQAYWVTWLIIRAFALQDHFIDTTSSSPEVFAAAYVHSDPPSTQPDLPNAKKGQVLRVLIVNKRNEVATVSLPNYSYCHAWICDADNGLKAPREMQNCSAGGFQVGAYGTAVVELA